MQGLTLYGEQLWLAPWPSHAASAPSALELSVHATPANNVYDVTMYL